MFRKILNHFFYNLPLFSRFLADKSKSHCKKLLLLAEQNTEILRDQVDLLDSNSINLEAEAEKVVQNKQPSVRSNNIFYMKFIGFNDLPKIISD